jgi:hypothetical protein
MGGSTRFTELSVPGIHALMRKDGYLSAWHQPHPIGVPYLSEDEVDIDPGGEHHSGWQDVEGVPACLRATNAHVPQE